MPFFLFQLETSEEFEQISTAEERESFKEKLDEVRIFFFFSFSFFDQIRMLVVT